MTKVDSANENTLIVRDENTTSLCPGCKTCFTTKSVKKKYPVLIMTSIWGFMTNVERAIILPTMWLYFSTYWSESTATKFYGATMSAFSLSILIFTPVYACAANKGIQTKYLILFANQVEIFGNLAYLIAKTPWIVLLGRFISGIGGSCDTPMYADLVRCTSDKERTPYMMVAYVSKQLGIVFGPACTLIMHKLKWEVGDFRLSVYNGPGLLMAVLWVLHSILVLIFYPEFSRIKDGKSTDDNSLIVKKLDALTDSEVQKSSKLKKRKCCSCKYENCHVYGRYEVVTIFISMFAAYFCVMSVETALPPVSQHHFLWDEVKVSYAYLGASGLLIIMCILLHFLSKCIEDRVLVLTGLVILSVSYLWLIFSLLFINYGSQLTEIIVFITGLSLHVIGMPLALAVTESLYTKLIPQENLNIALSHLRTISNVAFLIGPLAGGIYAELAYIVFVINFVLCIISLTMFSVRYNYFTPEHTKARYTAI